MCPTTPVFITLQGVRTAQQKVNKCSLISGVWLNRAHDRSQEVKAEILSTTLCTWYLLKLNNLQIFSQVLCYHDKQQYLLVSSCLEVFSQLSAPVAPYNFCLVTKSEINYFEWYDLVFYPGSISFFLKVAHKELCASQNDDDDRAVCVALCRPHSAPTGPPGSEWPHARGDGTAEKVRTTERRRR